MAVIECQPAVKRVLFVDDNINNMTEYWHQIEEEGFGVVPAGDVDCALKAAQGQEFDLFILDIMMPSGDSYRDRDTDSGYSTGIELYKDLHNKFPNKWFLIYSNRRPSDLKAYIVDSGRTEIVQKKEIIEKQVEFIEIVQKILAAPEWYDNVLLKFQEIEALETDWNGGNEKPVNRNVLLFAKDLVRTIVLETAQRPFVVPTYSGGLQIEIYEDKRAVEIGLENVRQATVYWTFDTSQAGEEKEWELSEDWRSELVGLINKVFNSV